MGRRLEAGDSRKVGLGVSLSPEVVDAVDAVRGARSRSAWIEKAILQCFAKLKGDAENMKTFFSEQEILSIVLDPSYHRVKKVLFHCYNARDFPANVPDLLAGSDARGKTAILSILSEYAENIEDGWICPMVRNLREMEMEAQASEN